MNKNVIISTAIASVAVLAACAVFVYRKCNQQEDNTPRQVTSNANESHQNVAVQYDPEITNTKIFSQYKSLSAFFNEPSDKLKALRDAKQIRLMKIHGAAGISEAKELLDITQLPERYVHKHSHGNTTVYAIHYEPTDSQIFLIQFGDMCWTLTMPETDRFVVSGPTFENADTMSYLAHLLDNLLESWGL